MKPITYFVKNVFSKVLRTRFFVINFIYIHNSINFSISFPLSLLTIKLIFWKNHSFLAYGFYMKQPE